MSMEVAMEWGPQGLRWLSERCEAVVIVDVLSFSTSVAVAVARGAAVWPHSGSDGAEDVAKEIDATLVRGRNNPEGRTLSPASLLDVAPGERLIMPSANGSVISHAALSSGLIVIAGAIRNASAVAKWVDGRFNSVGLVPAGERWSDGSLRVCYEDLIGAGAIASLLRQMDPASQLSPDAAAAAWAFEHREPLAGVPSGQELLDRGFAQDLVLAEALDADPVVPVLRDGRYVAAG